VTFEANFTPCYEIGWRLGPSYWRQGYAWGMPKIYSFTVPANIASQSVMQRIGMDRVMGGNFAHPNLAKDDPLSQHVLYKIDRNQALQ